jgi:hypothetical protein
MKLVCPVCQAEFLLSAALNDLAARNAIVLAFRMTEIGDVLINYVQLFKPAKRALSLSKLEKMLTELVPIVTAGKVTVQGTDYPAPQAYFRQAMETMLASRESLTLPLSNHRYLFKVIAGYTQKANGQAEKQNEQGRKYGDYHTAAADKPAIKNTVVAPAARKPKSTPPADWRAPVKKGASDCEENQA